MENEPETTTPEHSETPAPAGDDPAPTEAAPAQPPADPPPAPKPPSKVLTIPTSKMGEIKKAERERGRLEARRQHDVAAKELGYESHEHLMSALQEQQSNRIPPREAEPSGALDVDPAAAPAPADDLALRRSRTENQLQMDRDKLLATRKTLNRARARETRQRQVHQEQIDAQKAEHELRFAAMRSGIQSDDDVDYAVNCLRKEIKGKSADELKGFDPADYFGQKLRKARPYLYGVQTREATSSPGPQETGTNGGAPVPASTTGPSEGSGAPVDARKLDDAAYAELLRKQGLQLPSVGMPI